MHISRLLVGERFGVRIILLLALALITCGSVAAQQPSPESAAHSQTITIGTVKAVTPINDRLWFVTFGNLDFVAYTSVAPVVGKEVAVEILNISDIEGKKHLVAYIMVAKK